VKLTYDEAFKKAQAAADALMNNPELATITPYIRDFEWNEETGELTSIVVCQAKYEEWKSLHVAYTEPEMRRAHQPKEAPGTSGENK
jgi:hypothetical protein